MLFHCCATAYDAGPTCTQHWVSASCLLGVDRGVTDVLML